MEKTGTERDWLSPKIPSTVRKRNGVKAKKKTKGKKRLKVQHPKRNDRENRLLLFGGEKRPVKEMIQENFLLLSEMSIQIEFRA